MPSPSPKTKTEEKEPLIYRIVAFLQIISSLFFHLILVCLIPTMIVASYRNQRNIVEESMVFGGGLAFISCFALVMNIGSGIASWKGTFLAVQEGLQNHITQHNQRVKRFAIIGCVSAILHMVIDLIFSYLGTVFLVMLVENIDDREFEWEAKNLQFYSLFPFIVAIAHFIFNIAGFFVAVWNIILVSREIAHYQNVKPSGEESL